MLLPNLEGGGAERITVNLANGFAARGNRTDMVLLEARGVYLSNLTPAVRVVDLGRRHVLASILPLVRYLRTEQPDVLISALDHVNVGAMVARRLAHVRTRADHGGPQHAFPSPGAQP